MTHPAPAQTTRPASASVALRELVLGVPIDVEVVAVFPQALYLAVPDHGPWLVAVVTADGIAHPNAMVLTARAADRPFAGLRPRTRGTVGAGRMILGPLVTTVRRWWDPRPALPAVTPPTLLSRARQAAEAAGPRLVASLTNADAAARDARDAVVAGLRAGDADLAAIEARRLLGLGPGLTPAGDDTLAGLLAGTLLLAPSVAPGESGDALVAVTRRAGAALAEQARTGTTSISATLLHHAARGQVAAPAAGVLHVLCGARDLRPAVDGLLAVGSTSGADLLAGLVAAASLVHAVATPASGPTPLDATGRSI